MANLRVVLRGLARTLNSSALRGYATNACFSGTSGCTDPWDSAPDYFFENIRQSGGFLSSVARYQSIQTSAAVSTATATVTSWDYGGTAKVSATVNFNGITIQAMVTETQELFARIPIDICRAGVSCRPNGDTNPDDYYSNGIADSWEIQQAGRYLDQAEDNEEG